MGILVLTLDPAGNLLLLLLLFLLLLVLVLLLLFLLLLGPHELAGAFNILHTMDGRTGHHHHHDHNSNATTTTATPLVCVSHRSSTYSS